MGSDYNSDSDVPTSSDTDFPYVGSLRDQFFSVYPFANEDN